MINRNFIFLPMSLFLIFQILPQLGLANERIVPAEQLLQEGYKKIDTGLDFSMGIQSKFPLEVDFPLSHSLPWPVQFQDEQHSVANTMIQYQPFGTPYFHGGCDLRVKKNEKVYSPVAGKIEAGHYSYTTNADGHLIKYFKPWPQKGSALYFEVAVTTESGLRYEFHHMNRERLTEEIFQLLNRGGGPIPAGTLLGETITWPDGVYHHIHYNIILPSGARANPEYFSTLIPDQLPPYIEGAFAIFKNNKVQNFDKGVFQELPKEFVIAVKDKYDHSIYEHPISLARLTFLNGIQTEWDFRQFLINDLGQPPSLWDFFLDYLKTPDGITLSTSGGYGTGLSLIRLKIPSAALGKFQIKLEDMSGNQSMLYGEIQ
ncbi:MAG TPA: hypothetical protein PLJ21_03075 [Pseudobdellovibrionaceae bacterium]|nr:hypothetical protein [Pseudobdellovibrionaceae bacterium]